MMNKMARKLVVVTMALTMAATAITGCGGNSGNAAQSSGAEEEATSQEGEVTGEKATSEAPTGEEITVAIVQPMTHTSLDQIRDTITSELEASGKNIKIVTGNANGDTSTLSTILSNEKADQVDIVVPIATSTAQSAKTVYEGEDTPIIFAAVSDPAAAGLTGDDCKNITGVSNNIPADQIVKLVEHFQPDYKKIGFLYTSSETNSVSTITAAKAYCDENGIAYEEKSIANLSELQTAAETLISDGVDALYTGNDNTIASAMSTYVDAAYGKGVPVYCGADSMVADGGFATVGVDYVQLGKQVANMVLKVVDGKKPSELPYETLTEYAKYINLQSADKLNLTLTDEMKNGFDVLVESDGTSHFGE